MSEKHKDGKQFVETRNTIYELGVRLEDYNASLSA